MRARRTDRNECTTDGKRLDRESRWWPAARRALPIAAVLVVLLVQKGPASTHTGNSAAYGGPAASGGVAACGNPAAFGNWFHDIQQEFGRLAGDFVEIRLIISDASMAKGDEHLEMLLDEALATTLSLQDPTAYPSLDPAAFGPIDDSLDPQSADAYAAACQTLTDEAIAEIETGPGFDQNLVASRLATIEYLMTRSVPHNFRSIVGLD